MLKYILAFLLFIAAFFFIFSRGLVFHPKLRNTGRDRVSPTTNYIPTAANQSKISGIALGVYQPASGPLKHGEAVDQYAQEVGRKPAFAWFSVKWQNSATGEYNQFDPQLLEQFRSRGIMPGITWDASRGPALNRNQPDFSLTSIAAGKHDGYISQVAKAAAAYRYPFLLRMLHEMNGNWYPWGYQVNGNNDPAEFVAAWKHIVDIFRREGATNVRFVWNLAGGVLSENLINQNANTLKEIYPGDDYVDWVALDGYANPASNQRSLEEVFKPSYLFVSSLTKKPLMLFEVGATENTNDPMAKANWITQGFLTTIPDQFPEIKAVNWFNSESDPGSKSYKDYRLDTSQNSLNAWKTVVANPLYQGNFPAQ